MSQDPSHNVALTHIVNDHYIRQLKNWENHICNNDKNYTPCELCDITDLDIFHIINMDILLNPSLYAIDKTEHIAFSKTAMMQMTKNIDTIVASFSTNETIIDPDIQMHITKHGNYLSTQKQKFIHKLFNVTEKTFSEIFANIWNFSSFTGFASIIVDDKKFTFAKFIIASYDIIATSYDSALQLKKPKIILLKKTDHCDVAFVKYITMVMERLKKFLADVEKVVSASNNEILYYTLTVSDQSNGMMKGHMYGRPYHFSQDTMPQEMHNKSITWSQVHGRISGRSINSVYLPEKQKKEILDTITDFYNPENIAFYKEHGINHKKILLFYGLPGTGKTSMIKALANYYEMNIATIKLSEVKLSDNNLVDAMSAIPENTILVLEEIDACFGEERMSKNHNTVTLGALLDTLDGAIEYTNQLIIMTTNHKEKLDHALIRNGRVDYCVEFKSMELQEIRTMTKDFYKHNSATEIEDFVNAYTYRYPNTTPALLQSIFVFYRKNTLVELTTFIKENKITQGLNVNANNTYKKKTEEETSHYIY
jgi:hypothetical protein